MTGSEKAYTAPRLEALSLRETRGIDINLGAGVGVSIGLPGLGS